MFLKSVLKCRKYHCFKTLTIRSHFKNKNYFKDCFCCFFIHIIGTHWKKTQQSSAKFCTCRNHDVIDKKCTRTSCCCGISLSMHTLNRNKEYLFTDIYGKSQYKHSSGLAATIVLNNRWRMRFQFSRTNRMVLI